MARCSILLSLAVAALTPALAAQPYDLQAAHAYSAARNGHAFLVAIDGRIVYEAYDNGWQQNQAHYLRSGTKSFNSALLAMAIEDGLISSFDERVSDTVTEWQSVPGKAQITYRQLLGLQSGIAGGTSGPVSYAQAIQGPTLAGGPAFSYGPIPFQSFGEALKRKLTGRGQSVADYIQQRLLDPLSMVVDTWIDWEIGEPRLPGGATMTAREWRKFGEMVRQGGIYNGQRIVSQALLDESMNRSPLNPEYGIAWWLPTPGSTEPDDTITAQGGGKQRLFVIRSHRMVIVRFGETTTWNDVRFLQELMPAAFATFGRGCPGTAGVPVLDAPFGSRPRLGSPFDVGVTSAPASTVGVLWIGGSNRSWLGAPLPMDLTVIGMRACPLLVSLDAGVPFLVGAGAARIGLPIPNVPALATHSLYLQASIADPGANPLGVTMSNGGIARIGVR